MASNRERQAKYRASRQTTGPDGDGERRLDCWVSTAAALALVRLARQQGGSKRSVLESLILAADQAELEACATDEDLDAYLGVTR